jgi:phosphoribosylpyrophosphate synthetase
MYKGEGKSKAEILKERLTSIFKKNGWDLSKDDGAFKYYKTLFQKFYTFLLSLSSKEQDLILPLISIYHYCPTGRYDSLVWQMAERINSIWGDEYEELFILTLTKPEDAGHSKGASFLVSHMRDQALQEEYDLTRKPLYLYENQNLLETKHKDRNNSLVVFVDDFIGSGETATETIQYYLDNLKKASDKVIVFSFVAMQAALESIAAIGVEFITFSKLPKGITESGLFEDKDSAKDLMLRLEEKLGIPAFLQLGYEQSEATATMMRTPDNTFPVFWYPKKGDGSRSFAPMKREP